MRNSVLQHIGFIYFRFHGKKHSEVFKETEQQWAGFISATFHSLQKLQKTLKCLRSLKNTVKLLTQGGSEEHLPQLHNR